MSSIETSYVLNYEKIKNTSHVNPSSQMHWMHTCNVVSTYLSNASLESIVTYICFCNCRKNFTNLSHDRSRNLILSIIDMHLFSSMHLPSASYIKIHALHRLPIIPLLFVTIGEKMNDAVRWCLLVSQNKIGPKMSRVNNSTYMRIGNAPLISRYLEALSMIYNIYGGI